MRSDGLWPRRGEFGALGGDVQHACAGLHRPPAKRRGMPLFGGSEFPEMPGTLEQFLAELAQVWVFAAAGCGDWRLWLWIV